MIILPIETTDHKRDAVIVVLDPNNLERLNVADPAEIILRQCGKNLINPTIMICFEKPAKEFSAIINSGDLKAIIKFLHRGWKVEPEDHDNGPQKLSELN